MKQHSRRKVRLEADQDDPTSTTVVDDETGDPLCTLTLTQKQARMDEIAALSTKRATQKRSDTAMRAAYDSATLSSIRNMKPTEAYDVLDSMIRLTMREQNCSYTDAYQVIGDEPKGRALWQRYQAGIPE